MMCSMCDDFESGSYDDSLTSCPECRAKWCACFNCGTCTAGVDDCPHCCEDDCEEEDLNNG